jgi:hypothetical protein
MPVEILPLFSLPPLYLALDCAGRERRGKEWCKTGKFFFL